MKKIIDLSTYPRLSHYEYFRKMAFPYAGMTANVDVTKLIAAARDQGGSTFLACLYAAAQAANSVPELRQRMIGEEIAEFDHCDTAHTVAMPDRTFCNCRTDCRMRFDEFLIAGKKAQEEAMKHHGFNTQDDETDLIFVSCVPWVEFTQVIQPVPSPGDCNPRIVFGKYIHDGDKTKMPLSLMANHALVDGRHIGDFFEAFAQMNDSL